MRFAPPIALAVLLLSMPPAAAAPRTHVVVIDAMKFGPLPKAARVGDQLVWVNKDLFRHTATARNGSFNIDVMPGAKAHMIVRVAGDQLFYCKYHPGMSGVLTVAPALRSMK